MKRKESFIVRTVADRFVFMPYGETAGKFSGLIIATETAAFIWEHIEEVKNAEEMADLVCAEFEVTREEALADIKELLDNFQKAGWIE